MASFEFRIVSIGFDWFRIVSIGFDFCFRAVSFTMLWFMVNSCFRFWIRDLRFDISNRKCSFPSHPPKISFIRIQCFVLVLFRIPIRSASKSEGGKGRNGMEWNGMEWNGME